MSNFDNLDADPSTAIPTPGESSISPQDRNLALGLRALLNATSPDSGVDGYTDPATGDYLPNSDTDPLD